MPKLKAHSGSKKRFKRTASGYKHRQKDRSHILTKKRTKRKRQLRSQTQVHASDVRGVARLLGDS